MSQKKKNTFKRDNRGALIGIAIIVVLAVSLFTLSTMYYNSQYGPPETDGEEERQYTLQITVIDDDPLPHSTNFFDAEISISTPLQMDGYTLGPQIERFYLWQDDVDGTTFDGQSNMKYSFTFLGNLTDNEMRVAIVDPTDPFELVVWNLGDFTWIDSPTFTTGLLEGENVWGEYWFMTSAECTGISYDIYFELGPILQ